MTALAFPLRANAEQNHIITGINELYTPYYNPGSFTVPTECFKVHVDTLTLTGTDTATLEGTSTLVVL